MVILRVPVSCVECKNQIDKAQALIVPDSSYDKKFICKSCFDNKRIPAKDKPKISYYCQKCRYHFKSAKASCPYCNKTDFLIKSDVSLKELL